MGNQSNEKSFSLLKKISRKNFKAGISRYAITVFSCVLIIVMGAGILAYASATTIGENIITNILTATGLTVNGTATTTNLIVDSGTVSLPNNSITDAMVADDITITNALYSTSTYSNPIWLTDLGADKLTSGIIPNDRISGLPYANLSIADGNLTIAKTADLQTALDGKITNPMTAAGDLIVGGVSGAPTQLTKGEDSEVLGILSGALSWVSAGVSNFLGLSDTPNSYTGYAGKIVKVNSGETALEFADANYLPLTGGTISGDLTVSGTTALATTTMATTTISALSSINGNIIYVKPGETIQEVINSVEGTADNPYTVMIPPGVYNENITMIGFVNIQGSGKYATIIESIDEHAIYVGDVSGNIGISNLTANHSGSTKAGIYVAVDFSGVLNINNCNIENSLSSRGALNLVTGVSGAVINCYNSMIIGLETQCCGFAGTYNLYNCEIDSNRSTILWQSGLPGSVGRLFNCYVHGNLQFGVNSGIQVGCPFGSPTLEIYASKIQMNVLADTINNGIRIMDYGTVSMHGGSIEITGAGTKTDLNAGTSGNIYAYGTAYTTQNGSVGGNMKIPGNLNIGDITEYADNAGALSGGLVAGDFYRTGDISKIVH